MCSQGFKSSQRRMIMAGIVRTTCLAFLLLLALIHCCGSDGIMDMLSSFIDLEELAEQAAKDGVDAKPVDRTYPVASMEMDALMQMHRDCRTQESAAMRTWCTGDADSDHGDANKSKHLCPRGITTHPCTGHILYTNTSASDDDAEFLWPWRGLRCDAFTDPTTVTHIYLPDESLHCEISKLDLSVMVSLEQLDLSGNKLFGSFPEWLGEMTMLRLLNLEGNQLTGDIRTSFAGNDALEQINLSSNNLTASTLRFFDAFHRLQHLDLSNNNIDLNLPRSLFASDFLRTINVSHNAFRGDLPELPVFQFLVSFDVSSNFLTGSISPELSLWGREDPHDPDKNSTLAIVDVANNLLTGYLPEISNQSALQRFDIHNNGFKGLVPEFPSSLYNSVKPADFDDNNLLCPLPAILLPSDLTCVCGDGYTIQLNEVGMELLTSGYIDESERIVASKATDHCVPCPEGYYSNSSTNQQCHPCPSGSTSGATTNRRADSCTFCLPGTFANESTSSSCSPCPPGTFTAVFGATSCDLCNPGEFAAQKGSTRCSACAVGTFSSTKGAAMCISCPAGTYVDIEGEAECLMCPKGTYQDVTGSVGCKPCPVGYIAPQPGHAKCSPCSPGSFYDINTETCILCRQGTFSAVAAQTECKKCDTGLVAEDFGNERCLEVAASETGYTATMTTMKCDPGMFNNGTQRTCQPCPPGSFTAQSGSRMCFSCAKGSFASSKGSSYCEMAPPGSFVQFEGAHRAELCEPNHVAAMNGSKTCTPCQPPSFSFLPGGIECSTAKPGEVYDHVEWPRLALDLAGVDLVKTSNAQISPIEILLQAWADVLTIYSDSSRSLHVLQVKELSSLTQFTQIIVAVETPSEVFTKTTNSSNLEKEVGDVIHQAVDAAENALDELLDELTGSSTGKGQQSDVDRLTDLVTSNSFQNALVRQFGRANLFNGALSFNMVNMSMVEPLFISTRAVPCAPGTFFSNLSGNERVCLPCPLGSYSSTSGALQCEICPRGTFSAKEGLKKCESCPIGADAAPGASSCVQCSWFTYECEGFWQDLIAVVCIGAALLCVLYKKIRKLCVGDEAAQQQDESVALMTAVRAHGRTFDNVRYAPMGMISADAMFGNVFDTTNQL